MTNPQRKSTYKETEYLLINKHKQNPPHIAYRFKLWIRDRPSTDLKFPVLTSVSKQKLTNALEINISSQGLFLTPNIMM